MDPAERVQLRVHGDSSLPTLIYLPGVHGDWTLIGGLRQALAGRVRFAEMTYPRTLSWSLDDYAAGLEGALFGRGINSGWLLGESFGSQIVWPIAARKKLAVEGIILAGGFVRHPFRPAVRLAERVCSGIPLALISPLLFGYAMVARFRFRRSPEMAANIDEFVARRTELDRRALVHRLSLIGAADPCSAAQAANVPVYGLSGWLDPIVPWPTARRWLRRNCPALREYKVVWPADHNVLGTAPQRSAEQILRWMSCAK